MYRGMIKDRVNEIVSRLGGPKAVAEHCNASIEAVYKWPKIGIPWKHWPVIQAHPAGVTQDELRAARPVAKATRNEGMAA